MTPWYLRPLSAFWYKVIFWTYLAIAFLAGWAIHFAWHPF